MAIEHRIKPKYKTKNEQIVARIRAEAGAGAPIDPLAAIKKKTAELAYLLALHRGGDWRVQTEDDVVMIARRRPRRPQTRR